MSDPGSSVSERSPLLNEVCECELIENHYLFVMQWQVDGLKSQKLKRQLANVVSLVMRYGTVKLNLLSCNYKESSDYTGYAVYADRTRIWLVARVRRYVDHVFDAIINATIGDKDVPMQWRDVKNAEGIVIQEGVPAVVKMHLNMWGRKLFSTDVVSTLKVNFERVLRAQMSMDDEFKWCPIRRYTFMCDGGIYPDYFADDYVRDPFQPDCIVYYWSVCKRNEWQTKTNNISNAVNCYKRKCIDL